MALRFGAVACLVGGGLGAGRGVGAGPDRGGVWAWRRRSGPWSGPGGERGTALGAAVIWAGLAVGLGLVSQVVAWSEPLASGRPLAGHWTYLSALATLAALISVLNARTPGRRGVGAS